MIHIGYITNIGDLERIRNPVFQEMFAAVLTDAIRDLFIRID
jgi:N-acetylmuramoyl-L-alanine amidase